MAELPLTEKEVARIREQINANASASKRFKRLSSMAWRDASIVSLLFLGLTSREICGLRIADWEFGSLVVNPKWGGRWKVKLDAETERYLDHYLSDLEDDRVMLFRSQRGNPLNVRTVERMISKLGDQLEMDIVPSRLTISAEQNKLALSE